MYVRLFLTDISYVLPNSIYFIINLVLHSYVPLWDHAHFDIIIENTNRNNSNNILPFMKLNEFIVQKEIKIYEKHRKYLCKYILLNTFPDTTAFYTLQQLNTLNVL